MNRSARGVLEPIVAAKEREVEQLRPRRAELRLAAETAPPARGFTGALRGPDVALIAEFKRRSPSAGWIRQAACVAEVTPVYEQAGAAALSVLTDAAFFGGALVDLQEARKVTSLPVLRKDFIIDAVQVHEARAAGADAVLLIARILDAHQLADLLSVASSCGLAALVEAHDESEVEQALQVGAAIVGINNRDLASFQTDPAKSLSMAALVPRDVVLVAESGVRGGGDVEACARAGFDAVLVGEHLMRAADPAASIAELLGHARITRVPQRVEH